MISSANSMKLGYSKFSVISFRVIDAWYSEFSIIGLLYFMVSIIRHRSKIFCSRKCRRCVDLGSPTCSASYLNWYNSTLVLFVFNLPLIEIARTQFFVRWMDCNTPFLEYVLSCVFRFLDRIFRFASCICFVL